MTTIRRIVLTLLVSLGVLGFSGCSTKTVYVPQKCLVELPQKDVFSYSCTSKFPLDDFKYAECLTEKIILLESDYNKLEVAFKGCK